MAYTKQVKAANSLNNGFTSFQSGDGVTLFNASHPLVNGGTNANRPSTGADLNKRHSKMRLSKSLRSLMSAVFSCCTSTSLDRSSALMFTADRLLETTQRVGTADNDINAIRNMGDPRRLRSHHYLTDSNAFFIITDVPNGMKMFGVLRNVYGR